MQGSTEHLNDIFTVDFGAPSFVTFEVTKIIPEKKLVWQVTDCYLQWFTDKKEWKDTEVVWRISTEKAVTVIKFTHVGLIPEIECYESCLKGWDQYVKGSLLKLMTEGKGVPA